MLSLWILETLLTYEHSGVAANGTADMTDDDDQPLASWIHGGNSSSGSDLIV